MDARLLQKLLANAQKNKKLIDQKISEIQEREFSSSVGNGMLEIVANGKYEVVRCTISDGAMVDKETLQDLFIVAMNQVISQIQQELKKTEEFLPKGIF